jgi:hypothetical protein
MSADNWLQEYHLTPRGWIEGTSTSYGRVEKTVERPSDAVETWTEHLTQSSMYSPTYSSKKLIWTSPDHTQEERDAIRAQFKEPFNGYAPGPLEGLSRSGPGPRQVTPDNEPRRFNFGDPPDHQ